MPDNNMVDINLEELSIKNPKISYADGDIAIIDKMRDLSGLKPLCAHMNFVILCCSGRIQFDINGNAITLNKGEMLLSAPNVVLDNYLISVDFECKILCLSDGIIHSLLRKNINTWNLAVYVKKINIVSLPESEKEQMAYYYGLIKYKMEHPERKYRSEIMHSVIRGLLLDLTGFLESSIDDKSDGKVSQGRLLFNKFLNNLSNQDVRRMSVARYASELAVTPKYLTMVCRKYSGKCALDWIEQYTIEDIKYYLRSTDYSVKEITNLLGFTNMSYFGSYVRRHFGMSPSEFRNQKE